MRSMRDVAPLLVALTLAACGDGELPLEPVTGDDLLLLTQSEDLVWFPLVQYRGSVVVDEAGCMRLDLEAPDNATIVWPSGTTVWMRGETRILRNEFGREMLDIGERGRFSGGDAAALEELTDLTSEEREDVRDRCPGPYWLVTDGTVRRDPG